MKRVLIVLAFAVSAFFVSYGATALAWPIHDRWPKYGYFDNGFDNEGTSVMPRSCSGEFRYWNGENWCNAFPAWVGTGDTPAADFVNYIRDRADGGYGNQETTGAQFIIHTIIGSPPWERYRSIQEWQYQRFWDTMITAEAQGRINWWENFNFNINSFWQGTDTGPNYNDDAFFDKTGNGFAMVISNPSGGAPYVLRWECANPVGRDDVAWVRAWNMDGFSSVTNETSAARGNRPQPGDRIRFTHELVNRGPNHTGQEIWFEVRDQNENILQGSTPSGEYAPNESRIVDNDEVITIPLGTPAGTRYCRKIAYVYSDSNGNSEASALACAEVVANSNYSLTPQINTVITRQGVPVTDGTAEQGDSITFTYTVNNSGPSESQSVSCTYRQATYPGNNQTPPSTVFTPGGANCPPSRIFPVANTTTATETVPASAVNTTICRSLTITPTSQSGGTATAQRCVQVAAKPYTRIWGGDISAGNGLADASGVCTSNTNAAIATWNRRNTPLSPSTNYAGAGVQFAAFAMGQVTDFVSSLYNSGGAPLPSGLTFQNVSTTPASGIYGGNFGSLPCMPNYYATRPSVTQSLPVDIDALTTGVYGANSNVYWSGAANISPNERITVYIDGDLYINTNVRYAGTWNTSTMPLFEVIVRGNIYIDLAATQLDGVYVAQPRANGTGGEIHTCAATFPALYQPIPLDGNFYSRCNTKLTVNGLFAAKRILLLRTRGSLSEARTSEANTAPNIAEVFNFGPALWMAQPARDTGDAGEYDAIISLPPVL